jgi:hypothetical protein
MDQYSTEICHKGTRLLSHILNADAPFITKVDIDLLRRIIPHLCIESQRCTINYGARATILLLELVQGHGYFVF